MDRPTDDILDTIADHLNRDGIIACEDLVGTEDGTELSMPVSRQRCASMAIGGPTFTATRSRRKPDATAIAYDTGRFRNDRLAEAAWATLRREAERERFERRVEDWLRRLDELKAQIGRWVADAPRVEIVDRPLVAMNEDLMHEYGIRPRSMPSFDLLADGRRAVRFQPKGLWILGGNGRVDFITHRQPH